MKEYLETLEGGAVQGPVNVTEARRSNLGGSLGLSAQILEGHLEAGRGGDSTLQASIELTPPARFARLYSILEQASAIERLEACDDESIAAVPLGQIVDLAVHGRLSKQDKEYFKLSQGLDQMRDARRLITDLGDQLDTVRATAQAVGVDLAKSDPSSAAMLDQIDKIGKIKEPLGAGDVRPRKLVVLGTMIGYLRPCIVTSVGLESLKKEVQELEGDYNLFGKVIRQIPRGGSLDVRELSVLPFAGNRAGRRAKGKVAEERIRGPALVVGPVAIYV